MTSPGRLETAENQLIRAKHCWQKKHIPQIQMVIKEKQRNLS
jgi:hypothetical protein